MINVNESLFVPSLNKLIVLYGSTLYHLFYQYDKDEIIEAFLNMRSSYRSWDIIFNFESRPALNIVYDYITRDSIEHIIHNNNKLLKVVYMDNAKKVDEHRNTFFYSAGSVNGNEIELEFDNKYILVINEGPSFKIIKAKNTETDTFDMVYYISTEICYIINKIEHTETIFKNGKNIVYKFDPNEESKEGYSYKYLMFHHPIQVTDYTSNKQYILEYDDLGIMKSMIDISNPNKELCIYRYRTYDTYIKIDSIHPDIYNSFDKKSIATDFMTNNTVRIERVTQSLENLSDIQYKTIVIDKDTAVDD